MKVKVKKSVDVIVDILKEWAGVRAVILQHFVEKDVYDPNFSVTLDVFRDSEIPSRDKRGTLFPGAGYFESSRLKHKDRFLLDDLPIRISYKDCSRVNAVLDAVDTDEWLSMERGTYLFHRIATGSVSWSRDEWISGVLERLDRLPESLWSLWAESCRRRIDHYLSDLGAAALKEDRLYFHLSLSGFLKSAAELLFALNHVFEPGPRDFTASLALLEVLPEGFWASWRSLLRDDSELPAERKREIADHLARSVFALN